MITVLRIAYQQGNCAISRPRAQCKTKRSRCSVTEAAGSRYPGPHSRSGPNSQEFKWTWKGTGKNMLVLSYLGYTIITGVLTEASSAWCALSGL